MPANLPPQYVKAEEEYRRAPSAAEKLECLRKMWALLPKHKGTDKLQAELKQKISRTKKDADTEKKSGKRGLSVRIPHEGAGQVVILGAPNSGKSSLLAALTNAEPAIGAYPFTTHMPQPGMMPWQDVQVQLVDTPPITGDYIEGYLPGMVRGADAALLVVDLSTDDGPEQAQEVIDRLAQTKTYLVAQLPDDDEQFDVAYTRTLLVATKLDAPGAAERLEMVNELLGEPFEILAVSTEQEATVEALRDRVYAFLDVVRVYTKEPGKRADMDRPYTCAAGSTVLDAARLVHKDFADNLKFARCWGTGVFDGQTIGRDHVLHDGDILELHL